MEPSDKNTFHSLYLTQSTILPGNLRSTLENPNPTHTNPSSYQPIQTVTGSTTSHLEDVRTYDPNNPYIVGINGVIRVSETEVVYLLDGITYTTSLADEVTTYSFGQVSTYQAIDTHFLYRDERDVFIDKKPTVSDILMERNSMSAFDAMLRIASIDSLDDLTDYFK